MGINEAERSIEKISQLNFDVMRVFPYILGSTKFAYWITILKIIKNRSEKYAHKSSLCLRENCQTVSARKDYVILHFCILSSEGKRK